MLMIEFLEAADNGDISVTKFLESRQTEEYENEIDESENEYDSNDSEEWEEYDDENTIMSNN